MLRKVTTSPHANNKLCSQSGEWSLSDLLKFFERIHRSSRRRSTHPQILPIIIIKCCRSIWSVHPGWLSNACAYRAPRCQVIPSTHPPNACKRLVNLCWILGLGDGVHPCSVTNGFSEDSVRCPCTYFVMYFHTVFHILQFMHSFHHLLLIESPSHILVSRHPEYCSIALFEPFASEKLIYLSHKI